MDLKCYPCIADRWTHADRPTGMQPAGAADLANDAVTILDGVALCPDHAVNAADLAKPTPLAAPQKIH